MSLATNPTIYDLNSLGCIRLSGTDSVKFLQGQLTINAQHIKSGELSLGAFCNPQGRCVALFWATQSDDDILLIMPKDILELSLAHLNKYAVFFKTKIDDISNQVSLFGAAGDIPVETGTVNLGKLVANINLIKVASQEINSLSPTCENEQAVYSMLIAAGIPWLNATSQNEFLPHNLNLPDLAAVDFKKGCFTGQEVIARMQYKGKLKSHMQHLSVSSCTSNPVEPNAKMKLIVEGKTAGEVICAAKGPDGNHEILALIKDRYLDDKNIQLQGENGPILKLHLNDKDIATA